VLSNPIDALRHKAKVKNGILILTLFKSQSEGIRPWEHFELHETTELTEQMKQEALLKYQEQEEELETKRKDKRIADEKFSTRRQMALEENERSRLEHKKEEEKKTAEEDLYATFATLQQKDDQEKGSGKTRRVQFSQISDGIEEISEDEVEEEKEKEMNGHKEVIEEIYSSSLDPPTKRVIPETIVTVGVDDNDDDDIKYIPPPRHLGDRNGNGSESTKIGITFTPRLFPTPMRESKQAEEDDWIAKNRKYLSKHGQLGGNRPRTSGGGNISEEDPFWLKAKADDFYRTSDYHSAINAYSSAIELDENFISCYLNRSLCYLQLSDLLNCLSDCREGLEKIQIQLDGTSRGSDDAEEIQKLQKLQLKLFFRKGICHCHLGDYSEAIKDYQAGHALMIQSNKRNTATATDTITQEDKEEEEDKEEDLKKIQSIAQDIMKLQQLEACHELKKKADTSFGQKNLKEALSEYSSALELIPHHVGCLSNRAACKLALNDFNGCIQDSTLALTILNNTENSKNILEAIGKDTLNMLTAIIPLAGSEKRKSWYLKTLVRRGATYFQLKQFDDAIGDYGLACSLDPTNTSLKNDLTNLINLRTAQKQQSQQTQTQVIVE
jgi:dyslexia susceptibility 1 candidate gene 1 protein